MDVVPNIRTLHEAVLSDWRCNLNMKQRKRWETETLRARRGPPPHRRTESAIRQSQIPPRCRRPLSQGRKTAKIQNLINWSTYRPSLVKIDTRNFELSW